MTQKMRTLEEVCNSFKHEKGFSIELLGNVYCNLAKNKPVECIYCKQTTDHNDMYRCINLHYRSESEKKEENNVKYHHNDTWMDG